MPQTNSDFMLFHGVVRGMLPMYLLALLRKEPCSGSEIMEAIGTMSGGRWKPSPGSVYPLLKRLEEEKLISGKWKSGRAAAKRIYKVTARGRKDFPEIQQHLLTELRAVRETINQHIRMLETLLTDPDSDTVKS